MDKIDFNRRVLTEEEKENCRTLVNMRIHDDEKEYIKEVRDKALEQFKDMDDVECIYTYAYYSDDFDRVAYVIGVIVDDYWKFGDRVLEDAGDLEVTKEVFGVPGFIKLKNLDRNYSSFITENNSLFFKLLTLDDFDKYKKDNILNREQMALDYTEVLYYGDILYDKTGMFTELVKTYPKVKEEYNKKNMYKLNDLDWFGLVPLKIEFDEQPTRGAR